MANLDSILKKQRHYFDNKVPSNQGYGFSSCHAWIRELDDKEGCLVQFNCSVMSDSVTPWTAASQSPLSIIKSQSLLKFMSIKSVMPSNYLILCHPLLLPISIFPSIRVFSNESVLHIRWPKYWNFSFNISPSNQDWFPFRWTGSISLQSKGLEWVFSNTTVQKHQFFGAQLSL